MQSDNELDNSYFIRQILIPGSGIWDPGSGIWDPGSGIWHPVARHQIPGCQIA